MADLKKYDVDLSDPDIYNLPVFVKNADLKQAFIDVLYRRGQPADHELVSRKFLDINIAPLSPKQKSTLLKMFVQLNPIILDADVPEDKKIMNSQTKTIWAQFANKKMSELRAALYGSDTNREQPIVEMGALGGRKRVRSRRPRSLVAKTRSKSKRQRSKRQRSRRPGGKK